MGANNIKSRIDKMQQNSRFRLCGDREKKYPLHYKRVQQISTEREYD